jgi:hypothetical protein
LELQITAAAFPCGRGRFPAPQPLLDTTEP